MGPNPELHKEACEMIQQRLAIHHVLNPEVEWLGDAHYRFTGKFSPVTEIMR